MQNIKMNDRCLLESLIYKYGTTGVEAAINKLNEWNMWDKPKSDDFYSAAIRQAERNRPRLIDVVDELPKRNHDAQRYKDDPEYYEHIKRLEAQLRKTTDPQEAEYLERRINKLKSLSESTIDLDLDIKNQNIPDMLYHATPSCYISSIKKLGLGAKFPKRRFWDYENTQYKNKLGVFLAADEDYAYSFLDASDEFWDFAEEYEDRYDKELEIAVFAVNTKDLDISKLYIDENNDTDDEASITYFYDGIIPYKLLTRVI